MATFVMLTKLTALGGRTLAANPHRINEVNAEIGDFGCSVVSQYATLGSYDFVTVIEAPDVATMTHLSVHLGSRGTMELHTMPAIPRADFIETISTPRTAD